MSEEASDAIRIFSARACAAPLEKATAVFTESTGIPVSISVCARHCAKQEAEEADPDAGVHDFLVEIAEYGVHDLAIGGAYLQGGLHADRISVGYGDLEFGLVRSDEDVTSEGRW